MQRTIALLLLLATTPAWSEALPVFSDTGPDAAGFGQTDDYPVGTLQTLSQQDHLVGAYSHYDALFPHHTIARPPTPSPLARAPAELALPYAWKGAAHTLDDYLDRHPATGMLIARDRTVLFEHYRYGRTATDRFTSQSMAKTVLAMLVGIAVADGKIASIDDQAGKYVPELADTPLGITPIRALLHMASGIGFNEIYNGRDDMARLNRGLRRAGELPAGSRPGAATVAVLRQFDNRTAPPETVFHYASLNSELLGLILARATEAPLADYLAQKIWQPMGAESDATWVLDAHQQELAYCCLNATLRDWTRFAILLANDGSQDGHQIIPKQWLLDATTAPPPDNFLAPRRATEFYGYGYQTWILPGPRRQFALLGVHGQIILVDPASKLTLVHTAVRPLAARDPMAPELIALWGALVAQEGK